MVVQLVQDDFGAAYNLTAKHAALVTGEKVSAHLVKGVRARNGLKKSNPEAKEYGKIRSNYTRVVSIDVVRVEGQHIFGLIQDKTKLVYHYLAPCQTAEEAVQALKSYIEKYGKPEAVRCDNGSEFKGVFKEFLNKNNIKPLRPLPYNPKANGFIERYFRTLRQHLFRKLELNHLKVDQMILDDFALIWNHCRQVGRTGKTPGELANIFLTQEMLSRFKIEECQIHQWKFWHIQGIHDLFDMSFKNSILGYNTSHFN